MSDISVPDGFQLPSGRFTMPLCLTGQELGEILGALSFAHPRLYAAGDQRLYEPFWKAMRHVISGCEVIPQLSQACYTYSALDNRAVYAPSNPRNDNDTTPIGYIMPPFLRVGAWADQFDILSEWLGQDWLIALREGDVLVTPLSLPLNTLTTIQFFPNLFAVYEYLQQALASGWPRVRISGGNVSKIKVEFINLPTFVLGPNVPFFVGAGGTVLAIPDGTLNPLKWRTIECEMDNLSVTPETAITQVQVWEFDEQGDHFIDLYPLPVFLDGSFVNFGFGLRSFELCGTGAAMGACGCDDLSRIATALETIAQGVITVQGPQGAQGAQGAQGEAGPQGPQGPQGSMGIQGLTGPRGLQGEQGEQGLQGWQGLTGATGADGEDGQDGQDGQTPEFRAFTRTDATDIRWKYQNEPDLAPIWRLLYTIPSGGGIEVPQPTPPTTIFRALGGYGLNGLTALTKFGTLAEYVSNGDHFMENTGWNHDGAAFILEVSIPIPSGKSVTRVKVRSSGPNTASLGAWGWLVGISFNGWSSIGSPQYGQDNIAPTWDIADLFGRRVFTLDTDATTWPLPQTTDHRALSVTVRYPTAVNFVSNELRLEYVEVHYT